MNGLIQFYPFVPFDSRSCRSGPGWCPRHHRGRLPSSASAPDVLSPHATAWGRPLPGPWRPGRRDGRAIARGGPKPSLPWRTPSGPPNTSSWSARFPRLTPKMAGDTREAAAIRPRRRPSPPPEGEARASVLPRGCGSASPVAGSRRPWRPRAAGGRGSARHSLRPAGGNSTGGRHGETGPGDDDDEGARNRRYRLRVGEGGLTGQQHICHFGGRPGRLTRCGTEVSSLPRCRDDPCRTGRLTRCGTEKVNTLPR